MAKKSKTEIETKPVDGETQEPGNFSELLTLPEATTPEASASGEELEKPEETITEEKPRILNGEVFDPSVHMSTGDGQPVAKADGSGWRRIPGRKKPSGADPITPKTEVQGGKSSAKNKTEVPPAPKPLTFAEAKAVALQSIDLVTGTLAGVFGPDFGLVYYKHPESGAVFDERENLGLVFGMHYQKHGISGDNIPTGLLVLCAIAGYLLPRLKNRGFFAIVGGWIKGLKK